jgi:hypothetical protein
MADVCQRVGKRGTSGNGSGPGGDVGAEKRNPHHGCMDAWMHAVLSSTKVPATHTHTHTHVRHASRRHRPPHILRDSVHQGPGPGTVARAIRRAAQMLDTRDP